MGGDTGTERQLARSRVAIGYAVAKRQACAPWLVSTSRALPGISGESPAEAETNQGGDYPLFVKGYGQ